MDSHTISFAPLLIVILLAFLVPILLTRFSKFGIPIVVGEILAGIVVGQSGLQWVGENQVLEILSVLGFSLLMFLSGLEIDFTSILNPGNQKQSGKLDRLIANPLVFGVFHFLITLLGAFLVGLLLQNWGLIETPWIMALILSTTSLGVVVPVLKERGYVGSPFGQTILASALIADFVSILAISVYVLLRSKGLTLEILLVLVLFAVFVAVHRLTALFQKHLPTEKILERIASPTSEIKLRGAIVLALVFITLAESLGMENILGAFLAGVILSMASSSSTSSLRKQLDGIGYGFFIPIFFVMVGVRFDLPALLSSREAVLLVPILLLAAYIIKMAPVLVLKRVYSWRETFAAGFLTSSRLSLIIAAAAIGMQLGLISSAMNSGIILVAIITCILSPILFSLILRDTKVERDQALIIGARPMAELLVNRLRNHSISTRRLRIDEFVPQEEMAGDLIPQQTIADGLRKADISNTHTLIALDERDRVNYRICRQAIQVFGVENVIALVKDPSQNPQFRELGVRVVNMAYSTALIIESMAMSEDAFSVAEDLDEFNEVREVKLLNPELFNEKIGELQLPESVHILMLNRGGETISPDQTTTLLSRDVVTLVGEPDEVDEVAILLSRTS